MKDRQRRGMVERLNERSLEKEIEKERRGVSVSVIPNRTIDDTIHGTDTIDLSAGRSSMVANGLPVAHSKPYCQRFELLCKLEVKFINSFPNWEDWFRQRVISWLLFRTSFPGVCVFIAAS
jgi:hypothetical protein